MHKKFVKVDLHKKLACLAYVLSLVRFFLVQVFFAPNTALFSTSLCHNLQLLSSKFDAKKLAQVCCKSFLSVFQEYCSYLKITIGPVSALFRKVDFDVSGNSYPVCFMLAIATACDKAATFARQHVERLNSMRTS